MGFRIPSSVNTEDVRDQFLFLGNRARFGSLEHEIFFEHDFPPASSIFLFQARHPLRARVTSAFRQSSSVPIYPALCKSSSVFISRARVQIELESDVIELGELGLPIFRGGEGGPFKFISPVKNKRNPCSRLLLQEQVKLRSKVNFSCPFLLIY